MATLVIRDWPDGLHRELKKATIDRRTTLKQIMEEAARSWLARNSKLTLAEQLRDKRALREYIRVSQPSMPGRKIQPRKRQRRKQKK